MDWTWLGWLFLMIGAIAFFMITLSLWLADLVVRWVEKIPTGPGFPGGTT